MNNKEAQLALANLKRYISGGGAVDRDTNKAIDMAIEALGKPEPHWIPVTERLPDEDQPVLVTDGAVMWVCSLIRTDDGYKWENNMGYWHDFDEWKAWMPLPEPYKGVTE